MTFRKALTLIKETYTEWSQDKGDRLGAALAYYAVFSIPPLMMIVLAVLGFVYSDNLTSRLQMQLANLVGSETAEILLSGIEMGGQKGGLLASIIGVGILIFGATGVFSELQDALNTIWGVKPKEGGLKGLLRGRFTSFTMVLGICFLLLVSLMVSAVIGAMSERIGLWIPGLTAISQTLDLSASLLVITVLFAMIFKILPDVEIQWRNVWVGAFATAILFTAGKFVIGEYIGRAGVGSSYGAAGSIIVLITWIYYSAQILFFGAEFTQVYARHQGLDAHPKANAKPIPPADRQHQGLGTT